MFKDSFQYLYNFEVCNNTFSHDVFASGIAKFVCAYSVSFFSYFPFIAPYNFIQYKGFTISMHRTE